MILQSWLAACSSGRLASALRWGWQSCRPSCGLVAELPPRSWVGGRTAAPLVGGWRHSSCHNSVVASIEKPAPNVVGYVNDPLWIHVVPIHCRHAVINVPHG